MTEFTQELRHYCRNPRCRMKLPKPVGNEREAFCTRGCYLGFYRNRCVICEQPMKRESEHQRVCGRRPCLSAVRRESGMGKWWRAAGNAGPLKKPVKPTSKVPVSGEEAIAWTIRVNKARIIAPRRVLDRELP